MDVAAIYTQVEKRNVLIRTNLEKLVKQESPSEDRQSVNGAMALVANWSEKLVARLKCHKQTQFGDVLELRFGPTFKARKPILLLGHLDTVWPIGTLASMPWRVAEGRYWGPGVLDMKAGVIMALTALSTLRELHLDRPVTLLLNSDEEVGSTVSRAITERLALEAAAVLVLEPAQGLAYKTSRKGVGQYNVEVTGVGAHSGVDFERGHSAVLELAKLVQTISNFTNLERKLTVNCGVIAGGTRSNVVAS